MIPLLYQLSYTAPRKFRGIRYWIAAFLSRKSNLEKQIPNINIQISDKFQIVVTKIANSFGRLNLMSIP